MGNAIITRKRDTSLSGFVKYGKYTIANSWSNWYRSSDTIICYGKDSSGDPDSWYDIYYTSDITIDYVTGEWRMLNPVDSTMGDYWSNDYHILYRYVSTKASGKFADSSTGGNTQYDRGLIYATALSPSTKPMWIKGYNYKRDKLLTCGNLIEYIFAVDGSYPEDGIQGDYYYRKE